MLKSAGFIEILEAEVWELEKNGKYFFTRNGTTIFAFTVGGTFKAGSGFTVLGAHTDSPCVRIKQQSCFTKSGIDMAISG